MFGSLTTVYLYIFNTMDALIDRLFFPSKNIETSLIRKFTGSQNFLNNNSSLLRNIPIEYQQDGLENNWLSPDFHISPSAKGAKLNFPPFFRTFNRSLLPHVPKLSPCAAVMQEYLRLFSSPLNMSVDSHLDLLWETISPSLLWETTSPRTMQNKNCDYSSGVRKESLSDHLSVPITHVILPVSETSLTVTNVLPSLSSTKKQIQELCSLDQQMACRKTKELQKRSKKRRRRQKRSVSLAAAKDNDHNFQVNYEVRGNLSPKLQSNDLTQSKNENCDIFCDLTISNGSSSVQISLPNVSSFVVTLESVGEDDSDWDTNSDAHWLTDDAEFQVSGLFVTNLTYNSSKSIASAKDDCLIESELDPLRIKLKEVNQIWDDSTRYLERKWKSTAVVSFAPEEELVQIYPVEECERKGEWEIYACERLRFKRRINDLEKILSPCLSLDHRTKIFFNLYQSVL